MASSSSMALFHHYQEERVWYIADNQYWKLYSTTYKYEQSDNSQIILEKNSSNADMR